MVLGNLVGTSIRPFLNTNLDLLRMCVREIQAAGGRSLFSPATVQNPIGDAGRNILRANGINRLDFGLLKSVKVREGHTFQVHASRRGRNLRQRIQNSRFNVGQSQRLINEPDFLAVVERKGVLWVAVMCFKTATTNQGVMRSL